MTTKELILVLNRLSFYAIFSEYMDAKVGPVNIEHVNWSIDRIVGVKVRLGGVLCYNLFSGGYINYDVDGNKIEFSNKLV